MYIRVCDLERNLKKLRAIAKEVNMVEIYNISTSSEDTVIVSWDIENKRFKILTEDEYINLRANNVYFERLVIAIDTIFSMIKIKYEDGLGITHPYVDSSYNKYMFDILRQTLGTYVSIDIYNIVTGKADASLYYTLREDMSIEVLSCSPDELVQGVTYYKSISEVCTALWGIKKDLMNKINLVDNKLQDLYERGGSL